MKNSLKLQDEACLVTGQIINLLLADDYEICAIKRDAGRNVIGLEFLDFPIVHRQPESAVMPFPLLAHA